MKVAAIRSCAVRSGGGKIASSTCSGHGSFWRVRCQRWTARRRLPHGDMWVEEPAAVEVI